MGLSNAWFEYQKPFDPAGEKVDFGPAACYSRLLKQREREKEKKKEILRAIAGAEKKAEELKKELKALEYFEKHYGFTAKDWEKANSISQEISFLDKKVLDCKSRLGSF